MSEGRAAVTAALAMLRDADAPRETRAELVRRRFRGVRMVALGEVWRLGAVCLDPEGRLYATGEVLVLTRPTHPNHRSAEALRRNELRRIAQASRMREGSTVVLGAVPLDLDAPAPPLVRVAGALAVAWSPGAVPTRLAAYLAERAELLVEASARRDARP